MRVILVGPPASRARLRAQMNGAADIVSEHTTLSAAQAAGVAADALVMAAAAPDDEGEGVEPLTARERQVLELLADGLSNRVAAARLGISEQTVKFHVAAIYGKLGAANRADVVRRAIRRGLIAL